MVLRLYKQTQYVKMSCWGCILVRVSKHIEPLLEHINSPLAEENETIAEISLDFMLDQLHCNVVLASRGLVLSCFFLKWKHAEQFGQCRPKKTGRSFPKTCYKGLVRELFCPSGVSPDESGHELHMLEFIKFSASGTSQNCKF